MRNITKNFVGVRALDGVDFEARGGEVHALVGENGAGKSTLIKVLSGAHARDSGEILVQSNLFLAESANTLQDGPAQLVDLHLARANARKAGNFQNGISVIYQEFALAPDLTVAENIFIDSLGGKLGLINWKTLRINAEELLAKLGFSDINVMKPVSTLSVAYQQVVEICKALTRKSKILVLDEPTAVLTKKEIDKLFDIIADLKAGGDRKSVV
jgi:ribose transport system ATP-binding protein